MDIKSVFFGFLLGALFILGLIALTIYVTNKRFLKNSIDAFRVDNDEINKLIALKRKKILKSTRIGFVNNFSLLQDLAKELVQDIAKYYYPDSKYPYYEVTISEALEMNERILKRFQEILDFKLIGFMKNIRIAQIIMILDAKKTIEQNKIYQETRKYHLDKVIKYGYAALNLTNPGYWVRRLIYTSTIETTLRGVAIMSVNIIGEEATRLYSKKIIDHSDKILEHELEKFIKEIEAS